jgi:succinate dehydrogenase/fumarate reductase flavoprotein subunit
MLAALSDAEIDAICAGLRQGAAMVRYLQRLGVPVQRKPNGRPLVRRSDWERAAQNGKAANGPKWSKAA